MSRTALRRLVRVVLPGRGRHRGQPARRVQRDTIRDSRIVNDDDEQWIRDLLPPTPRVPEPAETGPWPPRITRWVRLACPLPDDTMLLSPVPATAVLALMARGFAWDPR